MLAVCGCVSAGICGDHAPQRPVLSSTSEEHLLMDVELQRLLREHYPFPIVHAHKKTLAYLDDTHKTTDEAFTE
jgi:hypothetical protein